MPVILEMSVSEQLAEAESEDGEVPDTRQIQRWANAASEVTRRETNVVPRCSASLGSAIPYSGWGLRCRRI